MGRPWRASRHYTMFPCPNECSIHITALHATSTSKPWPLPAMIVPNQHIATHFSFSYYGCLQTHVATEPVGNMPNSAPCPRLTSTHACSAFLCWFLPTAPVEPAPITFLNRPCLSYSTLNTKYLHLVLDQLDSWIKEASLQDILPSLSMHFQIYPTRYLILTLGTWSTGVHEFRKQACKTHFPLCQCTAKFIQLSISYLSINCPDINMTRIIASPLKQYVQFLLNRPPHMYITWRKSSKCLSPLKYKIVVWPARNLWSP